MSMALTRPMYFADRTDAARKLAAALSTYRNRHPLVLAIPRGGVPIGRVVADLLGGELDVVLVRKLGAPRNPELAIGAIDENGKVELAGYAGQVGADSAYVRRLAAQQLAVIRERRARYSPDRPPIDPAGRTVIIVDDGLATGATMRSALSAVRMRHPEKLVCAVPVAAPSSLATVVDLADDVVCLSAPATFRAVGQFYGEFLAVDDDEVIALLAGNPTAATAEPKTVVLTLGGLRLEGNLTVPAGARALVLFAHGSGSSRNSPRNQFVARELNRHGLATLLFDLLTEGEDAGPAARFDIAVLADRLAAVVAWARRDRVLGRLPLGLFGASTGAGAALVVAARHPDDVSAVVSRGGRPDLAGSEALAGVRTPTLLIVGGADTQVIELNKSAQARMPHAVQLVIVPGATHLFEEPGALDRVAALAADWFQRWLAGGSARTQGAPA
jgi:putative phosphoribosyl transferase